MEDKNPWNGYGKPSFHILYFSNIHMHFSNHVDTAKWPSPSKQCWNEETRLGQGKVYSPAQTTTHCLGGGEHGEKLRQIMSIVLRVLSPIVVS